MYEWSCVGSTCRNHTLDTFNFFSHYLNLVAFTTVSRSANSLQELSGQSPKNYSTPIFWILDLNFKIMTENITPRASLQGRRSLSNIRGCNLKLLSRLRRTREAPLQSLCIPQNPNSNPSWERQAERCATCEEADEAKENSQEIQDDLPTDQNIISEPTFMGLPAELRLLTYSHLVPHSIAAPANSDRRLGNLWKYLYFGSSTPIPATPTRCRAL